MAGFHLSHELFVSDFDFLPPLLQQLPVDFLSAVVVSVHLVVAVIRLVELARRVAYGQRFLKEQLNRFNLVLLFDDLAHFAQPDHIGNH